MDTIYYGAGFRGYCYRVGESWEKRFMGLQSCRLALGIDNNGKAWFKASRRFACYSNAPEVE